MSSPEDIARLKQLKESEHLHDAWRRWAATKEVRTYGSTLETFNQ